MKGPIVTDAVPMPLADTVQFDRRPRTGGEPYRIFLHRPPGEAPATGWPVLYLLDANAVIGTAVDIQRVQSPYPLGTGIETPFAIVGIGYPTAGPYDSLRRSWDYSPPPGASYPPHTPDGPPVRTGGADHFLAFIEDELMPEIASRIPIDVGRQALFGHSFGGLFVLHALFSRPGLFATWIAASPTIYWEGFLLMKRFDAFTESRRTCHAVSVLLSAGEYEQMLAPFQKDAADRETRMARQAGSRTVELAREMAERLSRVAGVRADFRLLPGRTHMSVLPDALNDAVSFAFGKRA